MLGDIDWCGGGNGGPAGAVLSLEDIASAAHFYYVENSSAGYGFVSGRDQKAGSCQSLMSAVSSVFACHCASSFTCRGGFVCMSHVAQLCAFIWEWDRSLEAGDKARAALFTKRASAPRLRRLDKVSGPGSRDVFLC